MTTLITPWSERTPIYAPVNGETADAADLIASTIQPVADQLKWTQDRLRGIGSGMEIPLNITNFATRGNAWLPFVDHRPCIQAQSASQVNDTDYALWIPLHDVLPVACRISAFGCRVKGLTGRPSSLPYGMPRIMLVTMDRLSIGSSWNFADQIDTSETIAEYTSDHSIQRSFAQANWYPANSLQYETWFALCGEYGANSTNGLLIFNAFITVEPYS